MGGSFTRMFCHTLLTQISQWRKIPQHLLLQQFSLFPALFRHRVIFHKKSLFINYAAPFFSIASMPRQPERIDSWSLRPDLRLFQRFYMSGFLSVFSGSIPLFPVGPHIHLISLLFCDRFLIRYNFRTMLPFTKAMTFNTRSTASIQHSNSNLPSCTAVTICLSLLYPPE